MRNRKNDEPTNGTNAEERAGPHRARHRRLIADILLIVGGLVLAYPYWSAAYARVQQGRLDGSYERRVTDFQAAIGADSRPRGVPKSERVRRLAERFAEDLGKGDPIGRLRIPSIGLNRLVAEGASGQASLDPDSDRALLRGGPVHYGITPLPGAGEPFAVAGHRTTYGAPFNRLDDLRRGDVILLDTPYARFRYEVAKTTVVPPRDVTVLYDRGYALVLTTCTPMYSATHRLIVWARLRSLSLLRGATGKEPEPADAGAPALAQSG
jgi:sortase A